MTDPHALEGEELTSLLITVLLKNPNIYGVTSLSEFRLETLNWNYFSFFCNAHQVLYLVDLYLRICVYYFHGPLLPDVETEEERPLQLGEKKYQQAQTVRPLWRCSP